MNNALQSSKPTEKAAAHPWLKKHVAVPAEHGAWVFLYGPLLTGLILSGNFHAGSLLLVLAATAAFLARQPLVIAVKAYSGRRPRTELPVARFWLLVYGLLAAASVGGLVALGYGMILFLAVPAAPLLGWYLWLISRREERRQMLMEILTGGALALAAPAGYWVGLGRYDPQGWLLALLLGLHSGGSIVYAYLRLTQRKLKETPTPAERLRMAAPALIFNTSNLLLAGGLALVGQVPALIPLAFGVQWAETLWGAALPAVGMKPVVIGVRQLIVSTVFTLLLILFW